MASPPNITSMASLTAEVAASLWRCIKARAEEIMGRLVKVMAPTASAAVGVGGSTIRIEVDDRALVGVTPRQVPRRGQWGYSGEEVASFNSAYTFKSQMLVLAAPYGRCHHAHRKRPDRLGWKGPLGARKAHARAYPEKPCLSRVFSSFCGSY